MQLVCPSCFAVNRVPRERLAERPVCGKCRARLLPTAPVALDDASFIRVAKVDTARGASVAARFAIRSIPTVVVLLRGREVSRMSGAVPAPQLLQWLDQSLAGKATGEAT